MSRANTLVQIWDIYKDKMLLEKKATQPGKKAAKLGMKPGKGAVSADSKEARKIQNDDSTGPAAADNFKEPLDTKNASKENAYTLDRFTNAKKFDEDIKKSTQAMINNNMKKSKFDQLFEEVTGENESQDLDALGINTDGGDENAAEAHDESITVTLTHDQVECLKSILSQVEGGAEGEGDEGDQIEGEMNDGLNDETPEGGDDDHITEDQVKYEVLGTPITDEDKLNQGFTNTKGRANVVKSKNSTLAKNRGTGDGKSTDKVTSDDKSFSDKKGLENINPKASIIKGTKTNKSGNDLFD